MIASTSTAVAETSAIVSGTAYCCDESKGYPAGLGLRAGDRGRRGDLALLAYLDVLAETAIERGLFDIGAALKCAILPVPAKR
jgi:hypothetical protein